MTFRCLAMPGTVSASKFKDSCSLNRCCRSYSTFSRWCCFFSLWLGFSLASGRHKLTTIYKGQLLRAKCFPKLQVSLEHLEMPRWTMWLLADGMPWLMPTVVMQAMVSLCYLFALAVSRCWTVVFLMVSCIREQYIGAARHQYVDKGVADARLSVGASAPWLQFLFSLHQDFPTFYLQVSH